MEEKDMILEMYNKYSEQVPAQFSRRQTDNRYFLGICLAIFGGLGWMIDHHFIENHLPIMITACFLGLFICASWAATICLYDSSIKSKCNVLRQMESKGLPYPLYVKDHEFAKSCCKNFLKCLRHYLPIIFFALIFLVGPIYFLINGKQ